MNPQRLFIENLMCHEVSFIDFTQFNSALIIGKVENNDAHSNGVGKTTIFKAIEYVLFNQADVNLEKIIRDDAAFCKVTLDFKIDDQEYRISRKRTKKGTTDLSLFKRTAVSGSDEEVYYKQNLPIENELYWNNISSRRAADTEKDLELLIKVNFKSFRSTIHFLQNDFTGLTTATPEKRKLILRDSLDLLVWSKLEKIAKEKATLLSKEIEKNKTIIDNLGNPVQDLTNLQIKLSEIDSFLEIKNADLFQLNQKQLLIQSEIQELNTKYLIEKNKFYSLLEREGILTNEKNKLDNSIKEYFAKKSEITKSAKELVNELKTIKDLQSRLLELDFSQLNDLNVRVNELNQQLAHHTVIVKNNNLLYEELNIPMPDDDNCKHCRQPLTDKHKKFCKTDIKNKITECLTNINLSKKEISEINGNLVNTKQLIDSLNSSKQQLESLNIKIVGKNKEIQDKKFIHLDYSNFLEKLTNELADKNLELDKIKIELSNSSIKEAENILSNIEIKKSNIKEIEKQINSLNRELSTIIANKAIINHNIENKRKDSDKLNNLSNILDSLQENYIAYPSIIQAFSSSGIPNLIIQNVLDDLQIEANNLLAQLRPGLQLSFIVEKTKKDGDEADTLDIKYFVGGRERYYEQLSGAMKLSAMFSLKLGLSFLLQKMMDTNIRFLLLDEIDQSLDKASVDAFADIIKFFQKDFTILVITHNDRLKDKIPCAILVEQDSNMVSRAKVVNSW